MCEPILTHRGLYRGEKGIPQEASWRFGILLQEDADRQIGLLRAKEAARDPKHSFYLLSGTPVIRLFISFIGLISLLDVFFSLLLESNLCS